MFEWLKKRRNQGAVAKRIEKHMATASGSHVQRTAIAVAMAELENELVIQERNKLSPPQQQAFMMAYECFLMWALMDGIKLILGEKGAQVAAVGMRDHFAKKAWYAPNDFERVWDQMQEQMPTWQRGGKETGAAWPLTDIIEAANQAGLRIDHTAGTSLEFGCHVIQTISSFAEIGKFTAQQQVELSSNKHHTLSDDTGEAVTKFVVSGYRNIAAQSGCAPTAKTTDQQIIQVYSQVLNLFTRAAEQKGEQIPAVYLNRIALKFLQVREQFPENFFHEHLRYEVDKYLSEGLRPEYKQGLEL